MFSYACNSWSYGQSPNALAQLYGNHHPVAKHGSSLGASQVHFKEMHDRVLVRLVKHSAHY